MSYEKGYLQVYTGNGKGKTTAALGICLRAICAGNKVFFGQFMKGQNYSELNAVNLLNNLTLEQFGTAHLINGSPSDQDIIIARKGLDRMREVLLSCQYDLIVFDEINTAIYFKLLSVDEVFEVLSLRASSAEIIFTGRYAPEEFINKADLVTEMREIKHYYSVGVPSRVGIEE